MRRSGSTVTIDRCSTRNDDVSNLSEPFASMRNASKRINIIICTYCVKKEITAKFVRCERNERLDIEGRLGATSVHRSSPSVGRLGAEGRVAILRNFSSRRSSGEWDSLNTKTTEFLRFSVVETFKFCTRAKRCFNEPWKSIRITAII